MHVSEKLLALRKGKGMTRVQLARETGLSVHSIVNYERNARLPDAKATYILECYFGINAKELYGDTFETQ